MTRAANRPPGQEIPADRRLKGFRMYAVDSPCTTPPHFTRHDYYKVILLTVKARLHYAHQSWELDGTYLLYFNPHLPYALEMKADDYRYGYVCLFTEEFITALDRSESLSHSPLFTIGGTPVCQLPAEQATFITGIFQKMLAEQAGDYPFKAELIRTYLQLLIHEGLQRQPTGTPFQANNAAARLTAQFLDLLEQQFPLESPAQTLALKSAQEFADRLAVHVNHLNRVVKTVTGKPTSTHITGRLLDEARALLHHTAWSIAEIAYCLGFAYPTYFNNFFKKRTGTTPLAYRKAAGIAIAT